MTGLPGAVAYVLCMVPMVGLVLLALSVASVLVVEGPIVRSVLVRHLGPHLGDATRATLTTYAGLHVALVLVFALALAATSTTDGASLAADLNSYVFAVMALLALLATPVRVYALERTLPEGSGEGEGDPFDSTARARSRTVGVLAAMAAFLAMAAIAVGTVGAAMVTGDPVVGVMLLLVFALVALFRWNTPPRPGGTAGGGPPPTTCAS